MKAVMVKHASGLRTGQAETGASWCGPAWAIQRLL